MKYLLIIFSLCICLTACAKSEKLAEKIACSCEHAICECEAGCSCACND